MTRDRDELEALQRTKLNDGLSFLREQNAFYRSKLADASLPIESLDAFRELPFTTKRELVDDQSRHPPHGTNLSHPPETYTRIHSTSGTTGHRYKCLDTDESWNWFVGCWEQIYHFFGVSASDRVFAAFGFGPFVGFWAGFEAAQRVGALAIPAGAQTSAQRLDWLFDSEATVLLSTPTYALRLAEVARERGVDLETSSVRLTIHASEPGASLPSIRERIASSWGATCRDHAGMSEVGPWGYECPERGGLHILESEFISEVLDTESGKPVSSGETGELVITNLGRWAMPALRYRTGDIVQLESTPCSCGSEFVRFPGGVIGRVDDMIPIRGVNVYPSAVEAIVRELDQVVEFQVDVSREREMWELRIALELAPGTAVDATCDDVRSALANRLGIRCHVDVVEPGSLPRYELKAKRFRIHR